MCVYVFEVDEKEYLFTENNLYRGLQTNGTKYHQKLVISQT
jgi:hypothetical protein